jgi:RHS repeat-associated protein
MTMTRKTTASVALSAMTLLVSGTLGSMEPLWAPPQVLPGRVLDSNEMRAVLGGTDLIIEEESDCEPCDCPNDAAVGKKMHISIARGTVFTDVSIAKIHADDGPTIDFSLHYDSGKADGSIGWRQTVLGRGWTHNYNLHLIARARTVFWSDEKGRMAGFTKRFDGAYTGSKGETRVLTRVDANTFVLDEVSGLRMTFTLFDPQPWPEAGELYQLTMTRDAQGRETVFDYNGQGLLATITDPYGRQVTLAYTASGRIATVASPDGVTQFDYQNTDDDLQRITDPLGNSFEYTYDNLDRMTTEKTKNGDIWTCVYNSAGRPQTLIDGDGNIMATVTNTTNWGIDRAYALQFDIARYIPNQTSVTDGCGNVTVYHHDQFGNTVKIVDPLGFERTFAYNDDLRLVQTTDEDGNNWFFQYNDRGNPTRAEDPLGNVSVMTYTHATVANLLTSQTEPDSDFWRFEYDAFGNIVTEIDPIVESPTDAVITHAYTYFPASPPGRMQTELDTDRNGNSTLLEFNPDGTLWRETIDPGGLDIVTEFDYDGAGRVVRQTVYRGPALTDPVVTEFAFDAMGRLVQSVRDPGGLAITTTHEYDGSGNETRTINPRGVVTEFEYDARERLVRQVFDSDGLALVSELGYDDCDNIISEIDPNGNLTTSNYDARNQLVFEIDPEEYWTEFEYDGRGNQTRFSRSINPGGAPSRTVVNEYDALSRRVREIQDPDGLFLVTQFDYSTAAGCGCQGTPGDSLVHKITDAEGKVTYFYYDALDRFITRVDKVGDTADNEGDANDSITRYEYDLMSNPVRITLENSPGLDLVGEYTYDAADRRIVEVGGPGGSNLTTRFTFNGSNNLIEQVTDVGNVITDVYDGANRLIMESDSIGTMSTFTYDANSNILSQADGLGNTWRSVYDAADRVVVVCDPMVELPTDKCTTIEYDANSNLIRSVDREGTVTEHTYDRLDRLISTTTDPGGLSITVQSTFDGSGNTTSMTDDNGNTTAFEYDAVDRETREIGADGTDVSFTYDQVGNRRTRTDQMDNTTTYTYDDLHRLVMRDYQQESPVDRADVFSYDRLDQLLTADNEHSHIGRVYDDIGRTISSTQTDLPQTYTYTVGYAYSEFPSTRTVTYPGGKVVVEGFDARDGLIEVSQDGSPTANYTYDVADRLLTKAFGNGTEARYQHNENNWVTELRHLAPDGVTTFAGFARDFDAMGNPLNARNLQEAIAFDNARPVTHSESYVYDRAYRLVDFKRGQWTGGTVPDPRRHRTWQIDGVHNWTSFSINDLDTGENADYCNSVNQVNEYDDFSTDGPPAIPDDDGLADDFMVSPCLSLTPLDLTNDGTVDDADVMELLRAMASGDPRADMNGDGFADVMDIMVTVTQISRGALSPRILTGFNRRHDKNGNLVDDGTREFFYDYDDRPVELASLRGADRLTMVIDKGTGDILGEYWYDAFGRRIRKRVDGVSSVYVNTYSWRAIEEYEDGVMARDFVYGGWIDEALTMDDDLGNRFYYQTNTIGSVITVTDEVGMPVERYAYDAYGEASFFDASGISIAESGIGNPYLFAGRRLDSRTGWYYFRTRFYDPIAGRFTVRDSIGIWGDASNTGNGYAYVGGNPNTFTDPLGLREQRGRGPRSPTQQRGRGPQSPTQTTGSGPTSPTQRSGESPSARRDRNHARQVAEANARNARTAAAKAARSQRIADKNAAKLAKKVADAQKAADDAAAEADKAQGNLDKLQKALDDATKNVKDLKDKKCPKDKLKKAKEELEKAKKALKDGKKKKKEADKDAKKKKKEAARRKKAADLANKVAKQMRDYINGVRDRARQQRNDSNNR